MQVWISGDLPEELSAALDEVTMLGDRPLLRTDEPAGAEVRIFAEASPPIAVRTYALVAPFPTTEDGLDLNKVRSLWQAGELGVEAGTAPVVAALLGSGKPAVELPVQQLLEWTWSRSALAIVGFDSLRPQWKVMAINGLSPLDYDFELSSYPLTLGFGVEGDPELSGLLREQLEWPPTNRDPDQLTFLAMSGVTALTRATAWAIERNSVGWATGAIAPTFAAADIAHVSHEVAFTPDCPPVNPSRDVMRFCGQPEQIRVLEVLGVDVVEITGNHVMDYGADALLYTLEQYRQRDWGVYGGGEDATAAMLPARFKHNGNRIVFLGCNAAGPAFAWASETSPGARRCDLEQLAKEVETERREGWLPIVTFQWAESYRDWPLPEQAEAFRRIASSGALIVSGSQAHFPQGMEFFNDSFIHYGLGNLFFDQMWSLETRQEFIDVHVFYRGRHLSTVLHTALLEEYARPRPMSAEERVEFLDSVFAASGW